MSKAPSVTEKDVDDAIVSADYTVLRDGRTTICNVTLDNGFTVRGESSCVSIANYNAAMGRDIALRHATENVWQLLGFRLADKLMRDKRRPVLQDSGTGRFVSDEHAEENPLTTQKNSP